MNIQIIVLCLSIFGLDRITKFIVQKTMFEGESITVWDNIFCWTYLKNEGIAFGFLPEAKYVFLTITLLIIVLIIGLLVLKKIKTDLQLNLAFGFVLGGALGNLYDRIIIGAVIDFLDFGFRDYRWPAFNVADSAICLGIFMILYSSYKGEKAKKCILS